MKKLTTITLAFLLLFIWVIPAYADPSDATSKQPQQNLQGDQLEAQSAILIDAKSGKVLFEKDADKKLYPASTTKIMTALLALENAKLSDKITAGNEVNQLDRGSSIIGLKPGETMTMEELLYGMLLASGNDAAAAIAVHLGGSIEGFAKMMNDKGAELGLTNSHFVNPHGLFRGEHYTTARDLAKIAAADMKYPEFRKIVSTYKYEMHETNITHDKRYWYNTNRLISENSKEKYRYQYATGIKTGYTSQAQHALVASAAQGNLELIAVVLHDTKNGKWTDAVQMFDWGFENYATQQLIKNPEKPIKAVDVTNAASDDSGAGKLDLLVNAKKTPFITLKKDEFSKITVETSLHSNIQAPVKKGQILGYATYKLGNDILLTADIIASRDVNEKKFLNLNVSKLPVPKFRFSYWWLVIPAIILLGLISRIIYVYRNKRRRRFYYRRRR